MDGREYEALCESVDRASAALRFIGPGRRPVEVEAVVRGVRQRLHEVKDSLGSLHRRDVLRSIGTLGMSALSPSSTIRHALMVPIADAAPADLHDIKVSVAELFQARQACQYDLVGALAPRVITKLQVQYSPEHQALLSFAYQAVSGSMSKLRCSDLAWVSAERAIVAASNSGDPLMLGAAKRRLAHVYMSQGNDLHAADVALLAANAITPDTPQAASVYGSLMLTAAIAAARVDRPQHSQALLDEAESVATVDANYYWLSFGPTNVVLHRVSAAIHSNDPGKAIEFQVPLDSIPIAERKAQYLIDHAHGYAQQRRFDQVIPCLLAAEEIAPEEVRYQPDVKLLVSEMVIESKDADLQALAVRVGLE